MSHEVMEAESHNPQHASNMLSKYCNYFIQGLRTSLPFPSSLRRRVRELCVCSGVSGGERGGEIAGGRGGTGNKAEGLRHSKVQQQHGRAMRPRRSHRHAHAPPTRTFIYYHHYYLRRRRQSITFIRQSRSRQMLLRLLTDYKETLDHGCNKGCGLGAWVRGAVAGNVWVGLQGVQGHRVRV